jgi:hypothetical protein
MPKANGDLSLFDVSAQVPDGFIYRQNFIAEAEEQELIREIQKVQLAPFKYYQFTGKRRTASLAGSTTSNQRNHTAPDIPAFFYRSGHARETSSILIQTVCFKPPSFMSACRP